MPATVRDYFDASGVFYGDFDGILRAAVALREMQEDYQVDDSYLADPLLVIFRGVIDVEALWRDIADPLERYADMSPKLALSIMQERGQTAPNLVDAHAIVTGEIAAEIHAIVRRHRLAAAEHLAARDAQRTLRSVQP
jgi:hypothetical protein